MEEMMERLTTAIGGLEAMIHNNQAKTDANLKDMIEEMLAKLDAHHERMMSRMAYQLGKMEACLVKIEATDLEANPEGKDTAVEQQEVPKEEAVVKTVGALKKQHGDRHITIQHCRKPKKQTQCNGESQKLATTCRRVTRHAIPI
jgi:hypothetical protein